jgi:hypothetical protein
MTQIHKKRKTKFRDEFNCVDCQINTLEIQEYYMIDKSIWNMAGLKKGMLCIGCLEHRLKRKLSSTDFIDEAVNKWKGSNRLEDRKKRQP